MRFLRVFVIALSSALCVLVLVDAVFDRTFPHALRLADNFSGVYLERTIRGIDADSIVFLGDSALWGYGVDADSTATSLLHARGFATENLSYEGGSPANTYAVLRLMLAAGRRPRAVVFNVNLKEFNTVDSAYQRLYPPVESLVWPLLSARQRARLEPTVAPPSIDSRVDAALSSAWMLYGMRADLRYALFGNVDAAHALQARLERASGEEARSAAAHRPTADRFEGTYDLSPIDPDNVSMRFLEDTIAVLRAQRVPAYAILTPTNHRLLRDFIDGPEYRANLATVRGALRRGGIAVVDYDSRFPADDFIDNDHLTIAGNQKLASLLSAVIRP